MTEGWRAGQRCRVTPGRQGGYSSIDVPHQRARVFW